jgi:hypothetical protein
VINGTRVRVAPAPPPASYRVQVLDNGTLAGSAPVPIRGTNRTLRGITFNRTGSQLRAIHDRTVVTVATFRSGRR